MLLREMQAFQACWMDLKDDYPTNREDNTLLAQAMGQLVDCYQKPQEVEESLPDYLKPLFRRLAVAYFQGYEPRRRVDIDLETGIGETLDNAPESDGTQHQAIVAAVEKVRWLAQRSRETQPAANKAQPQTFSEMDTLIIEIPEHWRSSD
jgi:hypothetical protein